MSEEEGQNGLKAMLVAGVSQLMNDHHVDVDVVGGVDDVDVDVGRDEVVNVDCYWC